MEIVSENRLSKLHPSVRNKAFTAYREAVRITPVGVHPFITETLRSFKRSDELYAQGRTAPGGIVTNSKGGQSYHNYGLAMDFVNQINGIEIWPQDAPNDVNWMKVVKCFKDQGFSWGGAFRSIKDSPHFQMTFGYNWRDLLALHNAGKVDKNGYVLI